MNNLTFVIDFFTKRHPNFSQSGILDNKEVETLANKWIPEIYFCERESFYPIGMDLYSYNKGNLITNKGKSYDTAVIFDRNSENDAVNIQHAVGENFYLTNLSDDGDGYEEAKKYFGASEYKLENNETITIPSNKEIQIIAEGRDLLETVKYNLQAHLDDNYPKISGEVELEEGKFILNDAIQGPLLCGNSKEEIREILIVIEAIKEGKVTLNKTAKGEHLEIDSSMSSSRSIIKKYESQIQTWIKYYFIEYYLIYPYNDLHKYIYWGNYHEADVEGFALVFNKEDINNFKHEKSNIPTPKYLISKAHSDHEEIKGIIENNDKITIKEQLKVYVAQGSHATYLSPGVHNILTTSNKEDIAVGSSIGAGILVTCLGLSVAPLIVILVAIIALCSCHSSKDKCSNKGAVASNDNGGSNSHDDNNSTNDKTISTILKITKLGIGDNIYMENDLNAIAKRLFPGAIGRHSDGLFWESPDDFKKGVVEFFTMDYRGLTDLDQSPRFRNATFRYIKALKSYPNL
jgi:hypothetical protein